LEAKAKEKAEAEARQSDLSGADVGVFAEHLGAQSSAEAMRGILNYRAVVGVPADDIWKQRLRRRRKRKQGRVISLVPLFASSPTTFGSKD
jgi:hypothetical protein